MLEIQFLFLPQNDYKNKLILSGFKAEDEDSTLKHIIGCYLLICGRDSSNLGLYPKNVELLGSCSNQKGYVSFCL